MQSRIALVILIMALSVTAAMGYVDVAVEITSPRETEPPGLVPVAVKLTNLGDVPALVPRIDVHILPTGYSDWREDIAIGIGANQVVSLTPWVCPSGSEETCTAWITYPADSNHANDTDVVIINATGVEDLTEMEPSAGMSLWLSPSPLSGDVLRAEYGLNQAGPAAVTLFDISGRSVVTRRFVADRSGELPLDLRSLSGGVYLVRLDNGRSAVTRKLVVQR